MTAEICLLIEKFTSGRADCSAFTVSDIPGAGRGLVAARDVARGETVVSAQAAVRGPCARAPPQCVNCLRLVEPSARTQCRKCLLLVCSEACSEGTDHVVECRTLSIIRAKLKRSKQGERTYRESLGVLTSSVTCLRMVSLKWRDPPAWALLCSLMDENVNDSVWEDISVAHQRILSLDPRLQLSDLRRAFGIQSTNGALLHLPTGFGRGLAVYPLQAFLNHSCMCNTTSQDFPQDGRVEIRARFNIREGEEITTSYIRPTQDTQARRELLAHTWHFWCTCDRCRDPTEGGSHLSAVLCPACAEAPMLPQFPLDTETAWACTVCQACISHEEHKALLNTTIQIINSFPKENINCQQLEEMIFQLSNILSPSHWMMMEIQQKLLNLYINMKNMNRPLKERKIQLCQTIIDYMDKIDPGNDYSRRKLQIMTCMVDGRIELMSSDYRKGLPCKEKLANLLMLKKDLLQTLNS